MKTHQWWKMLIVLTVFLLLPLSAMARDLSPIVSTDWLQANLGNPKLVIVDLRKVEDYKAGHIPNAVNVFYGSWAMKKGELLNELPPYDDLLDVIGGAGIGKDSWVVLVGKTEKLPDQFDATRVAWTLKYAGVENTAILNGGHDQWAKENKPLSQDMVKARAKSYKAMANKKLIVDKNYVVSKLGQAVIIDTRGPNFFEGKEKLAFVPKTGRVKGAANLPVAQLFASPTFKNQEELAALVEKITGKDLDKEYILYCDTGKTCTAWAFVMSEMLGYKDVKIYDGSFMEWAADANAPID